MSNDRKAATNVISVRFSDAELEKVKAVSERTGTPLSALIRRAALDGGPGPSSIVVTSTARNNAGGSVQASYIGGRFDVPLEVGAKAITATYSGGQLLRR